MFDPSYVTYQQKGLTSYPQISLLTLQLGGGVTGGDMLGGLGDIFGMPQPQSYVPPQEVSALNTVYLVYASVTCRVLGVFLVCLTWKNRRCTVT